MDALYLLNSLKNSGAIRDGFTRTSKHIGSYIYEYDGDFTAIEQLREVRGIGPYRLAILIFDLTRFAEESNQML